MLAALLVGYDMEGNLYIADELCRSGLTLTEAADAIACFVSGKSTEYAVASPDLWNRRQDSGKSGFEIMSSVSGMPMMIRADNRRVPGWRTLRDMLGERESGYIKISRSCTELIRCLPSLLFDKRNREDASGEPHEITHAPEALRYAVMSRLPEMGSREEFKFKKRRDIYP
jgi:phage terminase large subunit